MKRTSLRVLHVTAALMQGWGKGSSSGGGWGDDDGSAGGGWGSDGNAGGGGWGADVGGGGGSGRRGRGGWGSGGSGGGSRGGWGSGGSGGGGGGWGSGGSGGGGGGWGSGGGGGGGGGGWGSGGGGGGRGGRGSGSAWNEGDAGWRGASTGARVNRGRGSFRRGRGGAMEGVWGQPSAVDEEAWSAAPPSFNPPVRRVDPLTLTAVEVEIDGIKKLVGQRVQVSGVSDETTWHTLKDHLRQAGEVTFCKVLSGGRAVVEFVTPEDASRAITELQASELEGATIFLREDREDTVLVNTRKKIREARDAQLRARKEEAEHRRREQAIAEGDVPSSTSSSATEAATANPQL
ncbi:MRB1-associated protein (RGG2) [Trypanosoma cruzi cruzi]|uniref:Putative MRB1-associated protein n=1 Tax=Trypanosoma cruzi TaxID=5693 RepID=Q9GZC7_TRYCR|nr:RNA binding protein RGGm [Trypanosoma cruzi]PBJ75576.1 MRB1-associated protein (RGG2) [Trypanosoma cruzi cruzi]PWU86683.1 putative MRB1-associated protein [Trypanosoma cruzi]